jgi:hypothetical protein
MANGISPIIRQMSAPYLSLQEFKNAPTALDYGNLVVGGNQAAQDAELSNAILRASSWIDQFCNQIIGATINTEQQRVRTRSDGSLRIHPKYFPVVALTQMSYGSTPQNMVQAPDCSIAWFEEQEIIFPYSQLPTTMSSQGPLSFGFPGTPGREVYVNYTYVNGYANTLTATASALGATTITVDSGTGIVAGETLTIYDGSKTEQVTVGSSYVFGSTTVPLASPTLFAHDAGISISALPAAIKEAAILATSAFLKIRGDSALVLAVTNTPGVQVDGSQKIGTDLALAQTMLAPFRRIR